MTSDHMENIAGEAENPNGNEKPAESEIALEPAGKGIELSTSKSYTVMA